MVTTSGVIETDAANGELPNFSLIEPNMIIGHNDYHPAFGRSLATGVAIPGLDAPAAILGGEEFLSRIYAAYRGMQGTTGSTRTPTRPASAPLRSRRAHPERSRAPRPRR
jgi:hypothetical protein